MHVLHKELSQDLGNVWKKMTHSEKMPYFIEAERERLKHKLKYPYYRYRPKKKKEKSLKANAKRLDLFKVKSIHLKKQQGLVKNKNSSYLLNNHSVNMNSEIGNKNCNFFYNKQNFCSISKDFHKSKYSNKEEKVQSLTIEFDYNSHSDFSKKPHENTNGIQVQQAINLSLKN